MFCPNCGTKNPETATTCTKCGFNIRGAAAPKFKGTMLMMNQPGKASAPPPAPLPPAPAAAPPAAAPPPGPAAPAGPAKQAFKGTMVGVAPPGGFGFSPASPAAAPGASHVPTAATPQAPAPYTPGPAAAGPTPYTPGPAPYMPGPPGAAGPGNASNAPPPGFPPPGGAQPGGYAQPAGAGAPQRVNPLGGTVALDQMGGGFAQAPGAPYGAPPAGFGAAGASPPAAQPWSPPGPGAPGEYGGPQQHQAPPGYAPPQGYGPPPGAYGGGPGYGTPGPGGYGGPPPQGYGQPPQGYGGPPGGPAPYGAPQGGYDPSGYAPAGGMIHAGGAALAPVSQGTSDPRVRNPVMVTLLTYVTCGIYGIIAFYSMMSELKAYLNKDEIVPWHLFVPVLGLIILLAKLPGWVTEAKQRAGSRNPESAGPIMYFLLAPYFLTKDMNEIWDPMGTSR